MKKQKLYTVTKSNSDHSIKVGDIIWLSKNGDLNNVTVKWWLKFSEWNAEKCADFEITECQTHRIEVCKGIERVTKL